jgi:hypothetical protein
VFDQHVIYVNWQVIAMLFYRGDRNHDDGSLFGSLAGFGPRQRAVQMLDTHK